MIIKRRIRSKKRAFAALAMAALALGGAPVLAGQPAHADTVPLSTIGGSATLTVNDVTKAKNCEDYGVKGTKIPVKVDVRFGADTSPTGNPTVSWEVAVFDSYGDDVTNYIEGADLLEGVATGDLCSFLPVGRYRAVAFVFTSDADGNLTDTAEVTDAFSIKAAPSAHSYSLSTSRSGTTIKAQVKDKGKPVVGKSIAIQKKASGTWKTIAHRKSSAQGRVSYAGKRGTTYRFSYGGKNSAAVSVPVTSNVVKVSASKQGKKSYRAVGKLTASGKVLKGKRIYLQKKSGSSWSNVTSCVTSKAGKCAAVTTPKATASYRWKFSGDATRAADVSPSFKLKKRGS